LAPLFPISAAPPIPFGLSLYFPTVLKLSNEALPPPQRHFDKFSVKGFF
jgi:hypothetical protein